MTTELTTEVAQEITRRSPQLQITLTSDTSYHIHKTTTNQYLGWLYFRDGSIAAARLIGEATCNKEVRQHIHLSDPDLFTKIIEFFT